MSELQPLPHERIDLADDAAVKHWCEHFGVTVEQLAEAVKAAGNEPTAIREHLLQQGASAGAG